MFRSEKIKGINETKVLAQDFKKTAIMVNSFRSCVLSLKPLKVGNLLFKEEGNIKAKNADKITSLVLSLQWHNIYDIMFAS